MLAPYAGASQCGHEGERVVSGQRLMQAASDVFLGWADGPYGNHYYVRQLRDMKGSVSIDLLTPDELDPLRDAVWRDAGPGTRAIG